MTDTQIDQGTIQVLLNRLTTLRLPRALELKARVDDGEKLDDNDIEFLERVMEDASSAQNLIARHPELHELATRLVSLYSEITAKALQNEQHQ
jgi:hypothetical protein